MARALYIHWPFCLKKCPYCDFNSHVRDSVDIAAWQAALIADMRHEAASLAIARDSGLRGAVDVTHHGTHSESQTGPLTSIYFGGGTPSLMPPALVGALLDEAEVLWGFANDIEITLEGNPSSIEAANYRDLAAAGVNRASIGVQSFDDKALKFLGRLHSGDEARAAIDAAQSHFDRVSFDLIYALPGQRLHDWHRALDDALSLGTSHLSLYQLTIEPGTRFASDLRRGLLSPMDDDPAAELFSFTRDVMASLGMPAYEVSNFARPGEESRHNLTYWRYEDYLGIGPGAHGRRGGMATRRHAKPENWLASVQNSAHGIAEEQKLSQHEQAIEALMMGLRLGEGVSLSALAARFGMPQHALINTDKISLYQDIGLLISSNFDSEKRIGLTDAGMAVLDALLVELIRSEPNASTRPAHIAPPSNANLPELRSL